MRARRRNQLQRLHGISKRRKKEFEEWKQELITREEADQLIGAYIDVLEKRMGPLIRDYVWRRTPWYKRVWLWLRHWAGVLVNTLRWRKDDGEVQGDDHGQSFGEGGQVDPGDG